MYIQDKRWEQRLWTGRGEGSLAGRAWRSPLQVLSALYAIMVRARTAAYQRGLIKAQRVGAKVIVVGNISVGGTSKTPLAAWIARHLAESGMKPAVLARGYKGKEKKEPMVVSDGSGPLLDPEVAGDEPVLIARHLRGIPVVAGKDRAAAGQLAISSFGATHLVLDDGFQHLALARDLDILVIDGRRDPSREYLFPRGPLREPVSAAARAQALVLSRAEPDFAGWEWIERICPGLPVFFMRLRTVGLVSLEEDKIRPMDLPSLAFCGIGEPEGFFESLKDAGVAVKDKAVFEDHHHYTKDELHYLAERAEKSGALRMVTTEKDAVKIRPEWCRGFPVDVLRVEPDFMGAEDSFFETILGFVGEEGEAA